MLARGYPEHADLLNDIVEWRNLTKNAGTYIKGLLARCDVDGRVHGSFNIHGAASGRLSSTNPNLQNMPPASHTGVAVRSGFKAPDGWSLIDADYKQLEVRVAAELSGDPTMIQMFKDGGDPHAKTSETIYGKPDVSHYERMLGKIITFGLLYGRSPDSIATGPEAEDIVARGGKRWEPDDVREFFGNLLSEWNVYAKWRQDCREAPYRDGEITFSLGRKRRFHFIPRHDGGRVGRQGINSPCQGTASDFCLWSLIRLHERLKDYPAQVVCTVHDSLLIEARDDVLGEVTEIVREVMEKDSLWTTEVPLAVDLKVSKRWSQDDDESYGGDYVSYAAD
jgi:DNA polymerase-1